MSFRLCRGHSHRDPCHQETSWSTTTHSTTRSADGTPIAYERSGSGPAVVLVDGALCSRGLGPGPKLGPALGKGLTVYRYDRRGRGDSGDATEWSLEREVEDLAAVIAAAGGSASLLGVSSGGALALEAAARLDSVTRVAVYEVPYVVDADGNTLPRDFVERIDALIASGDRGGAVKLFMRQVGAPAPMVAAMSVLPVWKKLKAVAPTLRYDMRIIERDTRGEPLPAGRFEGVAVPVLVVDGGKSPEWMHSTGRAIAAAVPAGAHRTLPGQTHMVKAKVLAPAVTAFLQGSPGSVTAAPAAA